MDFVRSRFSLSIIVVLGMAACVVPEVNLEGRPCPCTSGWVCDEATNTCVQTDVMDASVADVPAEDTSRVDSTSMDSSVMDTSRPDAGDVGMDTGDSGLDACSTTTVTQQWGDHPTSDFPGTILDTWINLNPDHLADDTDLLLYTWPTAQVANAIIIEFDLAAIPPGATITDAVVQLHQWEATGARYSTSAHRIINCDPDIAGNQADGFQCSARQTWTPNSCCRDGVPMGQADIAAPDDVQAVDGADGLKSWSVTDMVQMWVATPSTNLGMMINSDGSAPADDRRSYRSSEHSVASERPRLVVTYTSCD